MQQQGYKQNFDTILQDLDRICKKQKATRKNISDTIDQVIEVLVQTNAAIHEESNSQVQLKLQEMESKFKEEKPIKNICLQHKECFNYISKMGKNMEKIFSKELVTHQSIEFEPQPILGLIQDHLIREGQFDLHDSLAQESGVYSDLTLKAYFTKIRELLPYFDGKDLIPVIQWAQLKKDSFRLIGSSLLFLLYRQHFIHLIQTQGRNQAIEFAKMGDNFKQFSSTNLYDISQLMTSLLFIDKIPGSRYETIYDEKNWMSLKESFLKDSLKILDQLQHSALRTTFKAGTLALPKLLKYQQIAGKKKSTNKELPIDLDIGKEFKFHSFFVCPVSREVCGPDNPPMLLKCGHVVSSLSILKMTTTPNKPKFKCPTCPQEQKPSETKRIYFL